MTKSLRLIEFRGFYRPTVPPGTLQFEYIDDWHANAYTGLKMYLRYALPVNCQNLTKLNVHAHVGSSATYSEPVFQIADVFVPVPASPPENLEGCRAQQAFLLGTIHHAVQIASVAFRFEIEPFNSALRRTTDENFACAYEIGKPKWSPDRKLVARIVYTFDNSSLTTLQVRDKAGDLQQSIAFARSDELNIAGLSWFSPNELRVDSKDSDAYWLCSLDGTYRYFYPRSSTGDPHHLYRHATILLEGIGVIPEHEAGMELLQQSASLGYPHAVRRWARSQGTSENS